MSARFGCDQNFRPPKRHSSVSIRSCSHEKMRGATPNLGSADGGSQDVARGRTRSHEGARGCTRAHEVARRRTWAHKGGRGRTRSHEVAGGRTKAHEVARRRTRAHGVPAGGGGRHRAQKRLNANKTERKIAKLTFFFGRVVDGQMA